jgi:hypothetical protein
VSRRALEVARKALTKPPRLVLRRAWAEATVRAERVRGPHRARALDKRALLREFGDDSHESCWERLRSRRFITADLTRDGLDRIAPGEVSSTSSARARSCLAARLTGTPT